MIILPLTLVQKGLLFRLRRNLSTSCLLPCDAPPIYRRRDPACWFSELKAFRPGGVR